MKNLSMKRRNLLHFILIVSCMFLLFNCSKDDTEDVVEEDPIEQADDQGDGDDDAQGDDDGSDDDGSGDDGSGDDGSGDDGSGDDGSGDDGSGDDGSGDDGSGDDGSGDDGSGDDGSGDDGSGDDGSGDDGSGDDGSGDDGSGDDGSGDDDDDNDDNSQDATTYVKDETKQVTVENFNTAIDVIDLGPQSIHNQIPIDTSEGIKFYNLFNDNFLLIKGVNLKDLRPENFAPIVDAHLQQDLSAALAWEDGNALVRPNTIYVRSHEENLVESVSFNLSTDKINMMYVSVRGDGELNFAVEETSSGVRFYSPITGQSLTLLGTTLSDLNSEHFEWRANQLEDNVPGRMGLAGKINNFTTIDANVYSGKSIADAGLVDRAPYHEYNYEKYTGTPRSQTSGFEN